MVIGMQYTGGVNVLVHICVCHYSSEGHNIIYSTISELLST